MTQTDVVNLAQELLDRHPPLGALAGAGAVFVLMLGLQVVRCCWRRSQASSGDKPPDRGQSGPA